MNDMCTEAALLGTGFDALEQRFHAARDWGFFTPDSERFELANGWRRALDSVLDDHLLTNDELIGLLRFLHHFGLKSDQVDEDGQWQRLREAVLLKMIKDARMLPNIDINSNPWGIRVPFNLADDEALVWLFPNTEHRTEERSWEGEGKSSGWTWPVIIPYYSRSKFKGRQVEKRSVELEGVVGLMGVTTKHVFFSGGDPGGTSEGARSVRISLDSVVALEAYEDGVGIMHGKEDRAQPEIFSNDDARFTLNLLEALGSAGLTSEDLGAPWIDDLLNDEAAAASFFRDRGTWLAGVH